MNSENLPDNCLFKEMQNQIKSLHVIKQREFSNMSRPQFERRLRNILNNPTEIKSLTRGRTAYWDQKSGTVVIRDPSRIDGGTAFKPLQGKKYYDEVLK